MDVVATDGLLEGGSGKRHSAGVTGPAMWVAAPIGQYACGNL